MNAPIKPGGQDGFSPVVVIGAGHAGCEAALASARMGVPTLLVTLDLSTVALMPCNPSIGGPGKGHLVREIGALGGEMATAIDETALQLKWLNTSKGPAVRARRAQADKGRYRRRMFTRLFAQPNLTVRQGQVVEILTRDDHVSGVRLETGLVIECQRLIIATGTYLESRIIVGPKTWSGGPHNTRSAQGLSESLRLHGVPLRRLQTATPPRINRHTVDFSAMRELPGDPDSGGFLWEHRRRRFENQTSCHLTFTTAATIAAVERNLVNSPLKLANITNVGPKHCPSIDRKVIRFPSQTQHQIFVEPEGGDTPELYLQGLTTSMPPAAQRELLATVPGLERASVLRYGYAIEYDALAPLSIRKTMASRYLGGLFTAGQINGTSGYEEAAAQGLIAGINAACSLLGRPPFTPSRTSGYIGVLVDDLSGWDHPEPYRITPSHAEFRLNLREDTAEARLLAQGFACGLVPSDRFTTIKAWLDRISAEERRLIDLPVAPTTALRERLAAGGTGDLKKQISAFELLQRPGMGYSDLSTVLGPDFRPALTASDEVEMLETEARYRGYADREQSAMGETRRLENLKLPLDIPERFREALSEGTRRLCAGKDYDDLAQPARKHCLSRSDLAILFSVFPGGTGDATIQQKAGHDPAEPQVDQLGGTATIRSGAG